MTLLLFFSSLFIFIVSVAAALFSFIVISDGMKREAERAASMHLLTQTERKTKKERKSVVKRKDENEESCTGKEELSAYVA